MKKHLLIMFALVAVMAQAGGAWCAEKKPAYLDTSLSFDDRARDLVSRLTVDEKASLLSETQEAIDRLGIPAYYFGNEALHGVVRPGKNTVFPQAIGLASTWDTDLILRVGTAISDEARGGYNRDGGKMQCRYCGLLAFWSPTINMARDPRWGRTPETYGEDPFLTGSIGLSFLKGLQGDDKKYIKVVSTPKHFAMNNEEHNRMKCNAVASERTIREYYLPAFQRLVEEGNAQSVMGAYNAINGIPSNANKWLLTDVLRHDWGFNGYVVTDCGALTNMVTEHRYTKNSLETVGASMNAGVDLECGGDAVLKSNAREAVEKGIISMDTLDNAVFRTLRARFRLGVFDPPEDVPYSKISPDVIGSPEHKELTTQVAREAIVLLKNDKVDGRPLLPLDKKIKSIAVVGPMADRVEIGDYSGVPANPTVSPLQGLKNALGDRVAITQIPWRSVAGVSDFAPIDAANLRPSADGGGERGLKGEYYRNTKLNGTAGTTRVDSRVEIDSVNKAPDPAVNDLGFSARWTGLLVPDVSGSHTLSILTSGGFRFTLGGKVIAEVKPKKVTLKAGQFIGSDVLSETKPERTNVELNLEAGKQYSVKIEYVHLKGAAVMKLEWKHPMGGSDEDTKKDMVTIRNSDMVIAFLGIGTDDEREGLDRTDLNLPYGQREYLKRVFETNHKTVVALVSGSPLSVNWIKENMPAIVEVWYPGEQGGTAIADVLTGKYNPAGRLPLTFYKGIEDLPPFDDYEVYKGRTYMFFDKEPLFPFGYGLSYTTFEYSALDAEVADSGGAKIVKASFDIANTGGLAGDEVAQLYARKLKRDDKTPLKKLRAFKRVSIGTGEKKHVELSFDTKGLARWDDATKSFVVDPGEYEIMVGTSSADPKFLRKTLNIQP